MKRLVYGICLTVWAVAVAVNGATKGTEVSTDAAFQLFRAQTPIRCSSNVGTGNQDSKLLNTPAKRAAFKDMLMPEEKTYFDRLVNSADHSVDEFTGDQLLMPLKKAVENLASNDKDTFVNIRSKWDNMTYDEQTAFLNKIQIIDLLLVKKELLCEVMGKLDEAAVETMCRRTADDVHTTSQVAIAFEDRCSDCVALAWKNRESDEVRGVVKSSKGTFLYEKLVKTISADKWDVHALMLGPDAVTAEDVNRVPQANFCDNTQRDRLTKTEFYSMVTEEVKTVIAQKLAKCADLRDVSSWPADTIEKFSPYLASMPKTHLDKISISNAVTKLNSLFQLDQKDAEEIFKAMAPKLAAYWAQNSASLNADKKTKFLCIMAKYAPMRRFFKSVVSVDDLKAFLKDKVTACPGFAFENKEINQIAERVIKDPGSTFGSSMVTDMGSSISSLSSKELKNLDVSVICSSWDKLKNSKFQAHDLKRLWGECKTRNSYTPDSITCDKIKNIGVFLGAMTKAEIDQIPIDALVSCAAEVGQTLKDVCKTNKGVCRAVWNRMKQKANIDMADMMKKFKGSSGFAKMVDITDTNSMDIDDMGGMESVMDNVDGTRKMASAVMKMLKRKYGAVSERNTNYTGEAFKKVVSLFVMGGRNDDIRHLPEDNWFLDGLKNVDFETMSQKKRQIVREKLTRMFGLDTNSDVCVEPSIAQDVAPLFADAGKSLLTKFQSRSLNGMLKGLGRDMTPLKANTRAQVKLLTNIMVSLNNLNGKSSIAAADVAQFGPYMWCGASRDLISKLEWDVFETFMDDLAQCARVHMDTATKQALVNRWKSLADSNSVKLSEDPERLASMGSLIYQFLGTLQTDIATLSNDKKEQLASAIRQIFEGLSQDLQEKATRNSMEISDDEKNQDRAMMVELAKVLMQVKQDVEAQNAGGSTPLGRRRRKRATDTITCDLLESFNGELSFLSADQVDTMDAADFVDCLSEFQKTDFATDVLASLATKLKAGINSDTSAWTTDNIIAAGRLLDSLDDADIDKLPLNDDVITGIAQYVFTKKAKLLARYLTVTSQTDTSAMTASTLATIGNLACGFTDSDITDIPAAVISDAAADLGTVPCFSESQLTAIGSKLAEQRGNDWSAVDPTTVEELGMLAGGLPQNVLQTFNEDLIQTITKEAIAAIPTSVFATVFTKDMLAYLSAEQANEVTDAQKGSLSADQLSTLKELTTINIDTAFGGSGIATTSVSLLVMLLVGWILQN